jgi:hypothetical protein
VEDITVDMGGGRERRIPVDLPSNSKKSKAEPRPPIERVVTNDVTKRRQGLGSSLVHQFFAEDSGSVVQYVVLEVFLPAAKSMISDAFSQGIDRVLFGEQRVRPGVSRPGYTNYSKPTVRGIVDPRPPLSRQARATHDFSNLILKTRLEAENVIDGLRNLVDQYQVASVADMYEMCGLTGEFTDNKWGWTDLRNASVMPIRGGYLLDLPGTVPLD